MKVSPVPRLRDSWECCDLRPAHRLLPCPVGALPSSGCRHLPSRKPSCFAETPVWPGLTGQDLTKACTSRPPAGKGALSAAKAFAPCVSEEPGPAVVPTSRTGGQEGPPAL